MISLFKKKFTLVIVCRNNITRSAYFAGYLEHYLRKYRPGALRRLQIISAGIQAVDGCGANAVMCFCARQHGFSLNRHRSRPVDRRLIRKADLLLTMSGRQQEWILEHFPEAEGRVFRLMEFGTEASDQDWMRRLGEKELSLDMPDPTGREASDFQEFIGLAESEADRLLHELVHRQII